MNETKGFMCHEMAIHNAKVMVDKGIIPISTKIVLVKSKINHKVGYHSMIYHNGLFYDRRSSSYEQVVSEVHNEWINIKEVKIIGSLSIKYAYPLFDGKHTRYDLIRECKK